MSQLYCIVKNSTGQLVPDLTDLTEAEEKKITFLIQHNKLPAVFTLGTKRIVSDTILGFYDKLQRTEPAPPNQMNTTSDVFDRIRQSAWYQRGLRAKLSRQPLIASPRHLARNLPLSGHIGTLLDNRTAIR